ncbi:MAG: hypothetical protein ACKVPX_14530 [Myxococcaceae bacterium]
MRWAAALVVFVYVFAFPYHPGLRSPNELSRLWQARAVVDFHTLSLNETLHRDGRVGDLSVKDGVFYPSKAPLVSMLAVPVYAVLKARAGAASAVRETELVYWARLWILVLPTLAFGFAFRRFLVRIAGEKSANVAWLTAMLGSLGFSYALLFMSHQLAAVLLGGSLLLLKPAEPSASLSRLNAVGAGLLAALAITAEYTAALGAVCLMVYGFLRSPHPERASRLGWAVLGAALPLALLAAYHQACFGHPLESGYRYLADAAYQPWHHGGFLGIRFPDARAFLLSFFSPLRGLFALCPFLLLAFFGLAPLQRTNRPLYWLSLIAIFGYGYFTSAFAYDSWGWTTGPRHLTPLVVFLLVPATLGLARAWEKGPLWAGIAVGSAASSVLITGLLSLLNYIPDSVSNGFFALVVPLWRAAYWPPTAISALAAPATLPPLGIALGAAIVVAALHVIRLSALPVRGTVVCALTIAGLCFGHAASTRHDVADQRALQLLKSVWLIQPGV